MPDETQTPEQKAVTAIDPNTVLAQLLEAVQGLKAEQERQRGQFEAEKANLVAQLETVKHDAVANAAGRPRILPENAIDPRTDHPEKNIEVRLDCMQAVAELNNVPFDRERQKRSLMGLPVEDPEPFRWNGRAFATQEEMDEYIAKADREKAATMGKYVR